MADRSPTDRRTGVLPDIIKKLERRLTEVERGNRRGMGRGGGGAPVDSTRVYAQQDPEDDDVITLSYPTAMQSDDPLIVNIPIES